MASRAQCICCIFCFLTIVSLVVILITLSYVGVEPRFYIQDLYIPSLNNSLTFNASNPNTSIFIHLKLKRVAAFVAIRYQDINITLFYGSNASFPFGYSVVPRFVLGKKKTVHRNAVVEARGLPWEDALRNISSGSTVAVAVEVATKYSKMRCDEDSCYYTKPETLAVAAEVRLDGSGQKVFRKPTRLQ